MSYYQDVDLFGNTAFLQNFLGFTSEQWDKGLSQEQWSSIVSDDKKIEEFISYIDGDEIQSARDAGIFDDAPKNFVSGPGASLPLLFGVVDDCYMEGDNVGYFYFHSCCRAIRVTSRCSIHPKLKISTLYNVTSESAWSSFRKSIGDYVLPCVDGERVVPCDFEDVHGPAWFRAMDLDNSDTTGSKKSKSLELAFTRYTADTYSEYASRFIHVAYDGAYRLVEDLVKHKKNRNISISTLKMFKMHMITSCMSTVFNEFNVPKFGVVVTHHIKVELSMDSKLSEMFIKFFLQYYDPQKFDEFIFNLKKLCQKIVHCPICLIFSADASCCQEGHTICTECSKIWQQGCPITRGKCKASQVVLKMMPKISTDYPCDNWSWKIKKVLKVMKLAKTKKEPCKEFKILKERIMSKNETVHQSLKEVAELIHAEIIKNISTREEYVLSPYIPVWKHDISKIHSMDLPFPKKRNGVYNLMIISI